MVPRAGESNPFPLVGPFNDDSTSSSPRPTSEMDVDLSTHQRDQDVHLAHSMRARSSTLLERAEMTTPSRVDRAASVPVLPRAAAGGGGGGGEDSNSGVGGGRRGPIVSDHLADDLEIQVQQLAENDHLFFERHPSSPDAHAGASDRLQQQQRFTPQTMHQSPGLQQAAASARFYRQRRNLSDSSIDSQGGAYIDHRRQPHSLSIGTSGRGVMGSGGSGGVRMAEGYGTRSTGRTGLRREVSGDDSDNHGRNSSPPSPSNRQRDDEHSGISAGTIRQPTSSDHRESAIADDDDDEEERETNRRSPRTYPLRQTSTKSFRSPDSRREPEPFSHELSRAGSLMGKPEEDVCFPAHGAVDPDLIDINMDGMYTSEQAHHEAMHHAHAHEMGVPGVLHNFPFPFDFNALEDFAEREKDGMPIVGSRGRTTGSNGGDAAFTISPPGYGSSATAADTRPRMGMNAGKDDSGGRHTMRQRKFSESVAPGRFQRKLALFEGGGGEDSGATSRSGRGRPGASILDTKTPLLATDGASRMGGAGGSYGAARGAAASAPGSGAARPYRFSFYSNSLPSTIHARSLAELPAEGQTFEELFVGHQPSYEEDSVPGTDPRTAFSPESHTGTGANTPNPSFNGARPAGIAQMQAELGAKAEKVKSRMMRSEVDAEANTWWLDVLCPTDQEMKVLSKVFGIHPLTTEDIQMEETREKIELFRNYYFVCFRSFEQDPYSPTYLEPLNMYIIVFREGTLSFHFRGTPHPQNVRRRIKQLKDYINVTSDWISYALIDDITDAFGPLIQNIEYEVDSIDDLVLILKEAEQSDMLRRIGTCRKKVMGLLRLMGNKADVVKGLSKRCNENWSVAPKSDIGLYLSDIQDHITTSTQNLTHYEKILSRSHSNYLAQISIEMTDANNQINNVLSKLTALGTVLVPMNLITGLWGMNVNVPGQFETSLNWFFGILGAMGAIAFGGAWLTYRLSTLSSRHRSPAEETPSQPIASHANHSQLNPITFQTNPHLRRQMVTCTRQGCGKEFDEANNNTDACSFHPGAPVFHEGLKSWSCCSGESGHRAVTSFDDFLAIPGCASGSHSLERAVVAPPKPAVVASSAPASTTVDGKEVYGQAPPLPAAPAPQAAQAPVKPTSTVYVEEQDDPEAVLAKGVTCKRKACGHVWEGEDRDNEQCQYHPGAAIFHEGSKGYSCCKKRTLDFDDFLAIKGCRTGKHLFAGAKRDEETEELVECRVDHYQTPREVIISVFGKGADKELSVVKFEAEAMHVDLILPSRRRFTKSFDLYGPINPEASSFKILGTKCEVILAKGDGRSWPTITALDPSLSSNFVAQLAFSAGGGRGTTGSKEPVLDASNKASRGL